MNNDDKDDTMTVVVKVTSETKNIKKWKQVLLKVRIKIHPNDPNPDHIMTLVTSSDPNQ